MDIANFFFVLLSFLIKSKNNRGWSGRRCFYCGDIYTGNQIIINLKNKTTFQPCSLIVFCSFLLFKYDHILNFLSHSHVLLSELFHYHLEVVFFNFCPETYFFIYKFFIASLNKFSDCLLKINKIILNTIF